MSGLTSVMDTALSGLDAFQSGAATVSENVSNSATPGYAVRTLDPVTSIYGNTQIGSGVIDPAAVSRAADQFAAARVNAATSANSAAAALSTALTSVDQALQGTGDVHTAAAQFFSDLTTLSSSPTSDAQRQTVMADAQTVVTSFNAAASAVAAQQTTLVQGMSESATQANQLLGQLAGINKSLQANPNSNSLLDQQQSAMQSLSQILGVSIVPQPNGAIEVTSGGVVLLDSSGAQTISVSQSSPSATPVVAVGAAKTPLKLSPAAGSMGGSLAAFQSASATSKSLNAYAAFFTASVNQAQAQGLDSNGNTGQSLFTVPTPSVQPASTNTGSAALAANVTNAAALPANGQGFVLTYGGAGAGWTATVPQTNQSYSLGAGPTLALPGMSVAVSGAPAAGDSFTVDPTPGAAASISLLTTQGSAIAAADPYVATAGTVSGSGAVTNNNAGTETEVSDTVTSTPSPSAAVVPSSYYGSPLTMNFSSPSSYTIQTGSGTVVASGTWSGTTGAKVAIGYPSTGLAAGQYWEASFSGSPAAGDVVTLSPGSPSSGSNASRMGALWNAQNPSAGASLQDAVLGVVSQAGSASSAATASATAAASTLTSATNNLQTVAGVNADQQAVLLTQFQQGYQAASQVISTANKMFDALVAVV